MPADRFVEALNEQIADEFAASHQYAAVAVWYEAQTMPRLAGFFYRQAVEERNHAMMMVKYLVDTGSPVHFSEIAAPSAEFSDLIAPIKLARDQEHRVSGQISEIYSLAREEADYLSEQFIGWFLREQIEEEATMSALLEVAERTRENPMTMEEFMAREHPGDEPADPTAPEAAGGAL